MITAIATGWGLAVELAGSHSTAWHNTAQHSPILKWCRGNRSVRDQVRARAEAVIAIRNCTSGRRPWGKREPCRVKVFATTPLATVLSGAGGRKPVLFDSTGGKGPSSYPRLNGIFLTFFIFTLSNSNVSFKLAYSMTKPVCSLVEFCTWKILY